jgi:hypothetical protein
VDNLRDGGGTADRANGGFFLNDSTVNDDAAADHIDLLSGGTGNDWFIYKLKEDRVLGMSSVEGREDQLIN